MSFTIIEAECQTVTPMLASGANQQKFEIRASEVKYGLRFWWRAFHSEQGENLFNKEAAIFGNTDIACPFSIRVITTATRCWNPDDCVEKPPIVQNGTEKYYWGPGMGYIFFSIYNTPKKPKKDNNRKIIEPAQPAKIKPFNDDSSKSGRPVLKPDNEFIIRIVFRMKAEPDIVKDILSSLWLMTNLSGLGARTRRGAGCFNISSLKLNGQEIDSLPDSNQNLQPYLSDVPKFIITPKEKNLDFFKTGLDVILTRWITSSKTSAAHIPTLPDCTCFREGLSKIFYLPGTSNESAFDLMERVAIAFQETRNEKPHIEAVGMHKAIADAIDGSTFSPPTLKTLRKAALGLPIIYNFRDNGRSLLKIPGSKKNATFEAKGVCSTTVFDRRSSPVFFSFHNGNTTPYGIICYFPSELFPQNSEITLSASYKKDKISGRYPLPDDSFVLEVLEELTHKFRASDVLSHKHAPTGPVKLIDFIKSLPSDRAIVRLEIPVAAITGKTCPCSRLCIRNSECISIVPGWTVKSEDVRYLGKLQKGSFLSGTINPQSPTRLNDIKLEKNIVSE